MKNRQSQRLALLALLALLAGSSCSDNPAIRTRYEAEKKFHEAERALQRAQDFQGQLSPAEMEQIFNSYREVADFCYRGLQSVDGTSHPVEFNELTYLTVQSSLKLAQLFYASRRFDSAEAVMNRLLVGIRLSPAQRLPVYLNLGRTLQAWGKFDSALAVYDFVVKEYYPPVDETGEPILGAFGLPLQVYKTMSMLNDTAAASSRLVRAEEYYQKLITEYPQSRLAEVSRASLADLYNETQQWRKEIAVLKALADTTGPGYNDIMIRMADVYGGRLERYDSALTIYESLMARLNPSDTALEPVLLFKMALAKMDQRKYMEGRELVNRIKKDYPAFYQTNPMPQFSMARSFEREGNWPVAEQEYSLLIEKYPGTDEAMMSLLYLYENLNRQGRQDEAERWFQTAETHFDKAARDGRGTPLEAKALFYKAELYRRNGQMEPAAQVLLSISQRFPGTEPSRQGILAAAKIYRENLGNPQKADSLLAVLSQMVTRYQPVAPDSDLFTD